eukprot:g2363.t1
MSHLLVQWLNEDVKLSKTVVSLEEDFRNGFLFGDLLRRFNQLDAVTEGRKIQDRDVAEAKIFNFCTVVKSLRRLDIDLDVGTVQNILRMKRGAALRVLLDIKMVMDQIIKSPSSRMFRSKKKKMKKDRAEDDALPQLCKVRVRSAKSVADRVTMEVFEKSLRRIVRNDNDVMLERHIESKFAETRRKLVDTARKMEAEDSLKVSQRFEKLRTMSLQRVKNGNKRTKKSSNDEAWERHMKKEAELDAKRVAIRRSEEEREKNRVEGENARARDDMLDAIDSFEKRRSAAAISPESEDVTDQVTGEETSDAFKKRIATNITESTSPKRAEELIRSIRRRKKITNASRSRRAWRRSKFIARQARKREREREHYRVELTTAMLCRKSIVAQKIEHDVEVVRRHESLFTKNREMRESAYDEQRLADEDQVRACDAHILRSLRDDHTLDTHRSRAHTQQSVERREIVAQEERVLFVSKVVNSIVDIAIEVVRYRDRRYGCGKVRPKNDIGVSQHVWNSLRTLFISDRDASRALSSHSIGDEETEGAFRDIVRHAENAYFTESDRAETLVRNVFVPSKQQVRDAFDRIDSDKSEDIDRKELELVLKELHLPHDQHTRRRILKRLDSDRNGRVDYSEFYDWIRSSQLTIADMLNYVTKRSFAADSRTTNTSDAPDASMSEDFDLCVCICGPSFGGRSVAAEFVAKEFSLHHFRIDDIIKAALKKGDDNATSKLVRNRMLAGADVPDELVVELIKGEIDALKTRCQDVRGWVLEGFPETVSQARRLERALSGFVLESKGDDNDEVRKKKNVSRLWKFSSETGSDDNSEATPLSGLDAVLRIECESSLIVARTHAERIDTSDSNRYDLRSEPLPVVRRLVRPDDSVATRANISDELAIDECSAEDWKRWFAMFGTGHVHRVSSEGDASTKSMLQFVNTVVDAALQKRIERRRQRIEARVASSRALQEQLSRFEALKDVVGTYTSEQEDNGTNDDAKQRIWTIRLNGFAESSDGLRFRITRVDRDTLQCAESDLTFELVRVEENDEDAVGITVGARTKRSEAAEEGSECCETKAADTKVDAESSNAALNEQEEATSDGKNESDVDKNEDDDEASDAIAPEDPPREHFVRMTKSNPPLPVSANAWYLRASVPSFRMQAASAEYLRSQWRTAEEPFVCDIRKVLSSLHSDSIRSLEHISEIRQSFVDFLSTPYHSGECIRSFQSSFNKIPEDIRHEDATKEELHIRVTEMCDSLTEALTRRESEAAKRLSALRNDGWLQAETRIILLRFAAAIQLELNKFWRVSIFVRDFEMIVRHKLPEEEESAALRDSKTQGPLLNALSDFTAAITRAAKSFQVMGASDSSEDSTKTDDRLPKTSKKKKKNKGKASDAKKGSSSKHKNSAKGKDARGSKKDRKTISSEYDAESDPCEPLAEMVRGAVERLVSVTPKLGVDDIAELDVSTQSHEDVVRTISAIDPIVSALKREGDEGAGNVILEQRTAHLLLMISWWISSCKERVNELCVNADAALNDLKTRTSTRLSKLRASIEALERLCRQAVDDEHTLPFQIRFEGVDVVVDETKRVLRECPKLPDPDIQVDDSLRFAPLQLLSLARRAAEASRGRSRISVGVLLECLKRAASSNRREVPKIFESLTISEWRDVLNRFGASRCGMVYWRQFFLALIRLGLSPEFAKPLSLDALRAMRTSFLDASNGREYVTRHEFELVTLWNESDDTASFSLKEILWSIWSNQDSEMFFMDLLYALCSDVSMEISLRKALLLSSLDAKTVPIERVTSILANESNLDGLFHESARDKQVEIDEVLRLVLESADENTFASVFVDLSDIGKARG